MNENEFINKIFSENKEKCTDLFSAELWDGKIQDGSRNDSRVYCDYTKFVFEIMKIYKPSVQNVDGFKYVSACNPSDLSEQEQQDVKEMIEAIIDTIHYAKYKRSAKK